MNKMELYREHKKIAYRQTNDDTAGNIVLRMLKAYGIQGKYYEARAKQLWFDMMGPTIGKYSENVYVKKRKLYVTITSASLRQEINYSKEKVRENINKEIGTDYLQAVVIW